MKKLKLYIETSTWNFYFAHDAPNERDITREFFEVVHKGVYEIYISDIVTDEIQDAPKPVRRRLLNVIKLCKPIFLRRGKETESLANLYLKHHVIPDKNEEDALHVAVATIAGLDALITWNYRHLAGLAKTQLIYEINSQQGYSKKLELITPLEVVGYENF